MLFGDSGPSDEEIRQDNLENARQREADLRAAAQKANKKGVVQLFGPGNPALNIPDGGTS